jgi:CheY-like chemotaxis protein
VVDRPINTGRVGPRRMGRSTRASLALVAACGVHRCAVAMIVEPSPPTATLTIPVPLGNVLLAEDDPELLDLLSSYLRRRGYRVFCAADGDALVQRIERAAPRGPLPSIDVIVSDIYMPGMDGLTVLEELREGGRRIPTILMTAFGSEEVRERGRRHGAELVLVKPFALDRLLSAVDAARFGRTG